jgi:hypothetical protein
LPFLSRKGVNLWQDGSTKTKKPTEVGFFLQAKCLILLVAREGYEPKKTIAYLQWFWMLASGVKR